MTRNTFLFTTFVLGVTCLFVLGFAHILTARIGRSGDATPAYSSLRSDPRGTKALYEGLRRMPNVAVERNYGLLRRIPAGPDVAVLFIGVHELVLGGYMSKDELEAIEQLAASGSRVIMSLRPVWQEIPERAWQLRGLEESDGWHCDHEECEGPPKRSGSDERLRAVLGEYSSPAEHFGFKMSSERLPADPDHGYQPVGVERIVENELPDTIPWHSSMYFAELGPDWETVYARDARPVIIERSIGNGSLVFMTDTFFLSNEGLREARKPTLLSWVIGPAERIVFDESLKGIADRPGIVRLMRDYRLHGFFVGLALVALLFIWQSATPLVPRRGMMDTEDREGRDALDGLTTLLDRSIPTGELLDVCVREWERAHAHVRGSETIAAQAREKAHRVQSEQDSVVAGYQAAAQCVTERMRRGNGGVAQSTPTTNSGKESGR